ncbi:N-acetyl sugar amidotransferase [Campylobacter sp. CCUG 57310]|uniref:N-acetyl sugar amidotransferase n=1 Tax=Campylobacter sp. CCUG 57310 TaxID=2517362 RepID=UPI001565FD73|nr:N-acetyl sugar amidotransferase [Campylobacter sp. CCUG 57310]QKF91993.1 pseudaminic acid biosynthesis protein, putative PseA [Campylobacter sp. CCUG 57310]
MKNKVYQICTKCIMDTSDEKIVFDEKGECDHCRNFQNNIVPEWNYGKNRLGDLMRIAEKIKKENKKNEFDCIIGLSGGLDSSYTAYVAKEIMGLRPLLLHVDAGWNMEQAENNIEKIAKGLDLKLHTETINWEEMRDLQVAFFKSQIRDQDMPQDIAFFSTLYKFARKNNIKYVLTGGNYSTECCKEPQEWGAYPGIDYTLIQDIHNKFGKIKLKTFPIIDILVYKIYYRYILGMKVIKPLDFVPFIKKDAEEKLYSLYGFEKFQHKHHDSRFTRFYEDFWLPKKHGLEKRRAHFSSLIMTGQMTREEALERISKSELSEEILLKEFEYVANRLNLTTDELWQIFKGENKTYLDYKSKIRIINLGAKIMQYFGLERRLYR